MKKTIAFTILLLLTACASVPQHSMQVEQIQSYKLTSVVFKGAENISSWPSEEEAYRKLPNADSILIDRLRAGSASSVVELQPYFNKRLEERFLASFNSNVSDVLKGSKPVKAIVSIKGFNIPSTAAKVFINSTTAISATIILVDAKTETELLKYDGLVSVKAQVGGVGALVTSVLNVDQTPENGLMIKYFEDYKKWLIKG